MTILGISMNTRLVSVAILSNNELIGHSTHLHKSAWSPRKRDEIITSLEPCVRHYGITQVALSIPYAYYQTKEHRELVEAINTFFASKDISVYTKIPEDMDVLYTASKKTRKKALMRAMVERFPSLTRCYQRELRNKTKYYYKLFEAVAAGALVHDEMK